MRKSFYLVALFTLLTLGLVYGFEFFPVTFAQERPRAVPVETQPARIVKWEYKHLERLINEKAEATNANLNKLGDEGWELVGSYQAQSGSTYFVLKRQKQ